MPPPVVMLIAGEFAPLSLDLLDFSPHASKAQIFFLLASSFLAPGRGVD